ncbi:MAG TPA: S1/P1 nuclease [Pyrinomonadaceae bacterium]|nr:S1/P1 nuclease [Pyrinomonadaceae bacterium]
MTPKHDLSPSNPPSETTSDELTKPNTGLYDSEFWAVSRHELIADVAEQLLKPGTAEKIREVLKPLEDQGFPTSLPDLAGWADYTKHRGSQEGDDEDTKVFLDDPINNRRDKWHYVNLPLNAENYSRELYPTLTYKKDVVQITKQAISVLKGDSDRFSQINALRLLVHMVGDLHQPIHVGCGYIDHSVAVAKLVFDPETIVQNALEHDRGGNDLLLPVGNNGVSLHEYWDGRLGGSHPDISGFEGDEAIVSSELKKEFSDKLLRMIQEDSQLMSADATAEAFDDSSPEDWIEKWTNESLAAAREAYKSLAISSPNGEKFNVTWEGKQAYDARCKPIALDRMKSSARNLALLLDAICL